MVAKYFHFITVHVFCILTLDVTAGSQTLSNASRSDAGNMSNGEAFDEDKTEICNLNEQETQCKNDKSYKKYCLNERLTSFYHNPIVK